ncbi:choice-of-anchor J domain-containing protein [Flavobacterium psychrotrophum]|uniref:choice-of-anchor J domain-containing protein n=1 Tax=Flavobacterium psychrotrophum TaxID=2294119 RepID=UPI000E31A112|nr:choice-of-anchor J domain-containing protein [Flavobacterium psychrotrophum]
MKIFFKNFFFAALATTALVSCDDDTELPTYREPVMYEKFEIGDDNTPFQAEGWSTFLQAGTAAWTIQRYSNNGYAEFNPYGSNNPVNIGWLISPAIELGETNNKTLTFEASQAFTSNANNKLEVFISSDYNGDVATATWTPVTFKAPKIAGVNFAFVASGKISLVPYKGNVRVAFKVTGSGTDQALDGSYQIDNVVVY